MSGHFMFVPTHPLTPNDPKHISGEDIYRIARFLAAPDSDDFFFGYAEHWIQSAYLLSLILLSYYRQVMLKSDDDFTFDKFEQFLYSLDINNDDAIRTRIETVLTQKVRFPGLSSSLQDYCFEHLVKLPKYRATVLSQIIASCQYWSKKAYLAPNKQSSKSEKLNSTLT